jgi:hypothetical protein
MATKNELTANTLNQLKRSNLKNNMLAKLNPLVPWSYCSSKTSPDNLLKMRTFLENNLDDFIDKCIEVLPYLTQNDSDSLSSGQLTEHAEKFLGLVRLLEEHGFAHPKIGINPGEFVINFWSGMKGREKAHAQANELSDSSVPSVCLLFDICSEIQKAEHQDNYLHLSSVLPEIISRVYASKAQGVVNVYVSSDKNSEDPGLKIGNNFWSAELPILQFLKQNKKVSKVNIHLYHPLNNQWEVIDFHSKKSSYIPILRRTAHTVISHSKDDIKKFEYYRPEQEFKKWCEISEPRRVTSVGRMRFFASTWRRNAKHKMEEKENINPNDQDPKKGS